MNALPVLHGPAYAAYVQVARLVLQEKGVPYRHAHFEFPLRPGGFELLNPFGTVPVLVDGEFTLYEAVAIARYVDEGFEGADLQPKDVRERARMAQIVSVIDQIAAPSMVRTIYTERFKQHVLQVQFSEEAIASSRGKALQCLSALTDWLGGRAYLVGDRLSLADIFAFPCIGYFADCDDGQEMLAAFEPLLEWLDRLSLRPAFAEVGRPQLPSPRS